MPFLPRPLGPEQGTGAGLRLCLGSARRLPQTCPSPRLPCLSCADSIKRDLPGSRPLPKLKRGILKPHQMPGILVNALAQLSAPPPRPDGPLALTWDQISALASRPILVDRQIPKPCRGLFEQVMDHCLRHMPPLSDPMPGIGDHLYILPKLLLFRGSHPNPTYNQKVKAISRNCQTALRGEWNTLWQAAMDTPTPPFRRLGDNDSVVGDGGLSRDTARSLHASAQRGQVGKAWRQLRTPPPLGITSEVWMQARHKLCPLGDDRPALPMFATPGDWHPTPGEFKKALTRLKPGKALDLGGWSSEILQNAFKTPNLRDLGHQWLVQTAVSTTLHARRAEMMHATKLVALDKGGGQLRPICVSTIWVKFLSYLLLPQAREHLDPHLRGSQFGVGTPQGASAMLMHIKAHLARFPEHVAVQLDFKNAFCTLHRQTCLEVVSKLLGSRLRGLRRPPTFSPALPTSSLQGMRTLSPHTMEYPRGTRSVPSSLLQR